MEISEEDVKKFAEGSTSQLSDASYGESPHDYNSKMRTSAEHRRLRRKEIFHSIVRTIRGDKELRIAVCANDEQKIRQLLAEGVAVNKADDKLRTALHFAASKGNMEILDLLLTSGADPNLQDSNGNTPLHLAACTNHVAVVTKLLQAGTNLAVCDKFGHTPLNLALSRLTMIKSSHMQPTIKNDMIEIVNMMEVYLEKSKGSFDQQIDELRNISHQLNTCETKTQMDEINDMLTSFTSMAISSCKPSNLSTTL